MEKLAAFHFLRPEWLLLLPVVVGGAILLARRTFSPGSAWERWCDRHLLPHILLSSGAAGSRRRMAGLLFAAGSALAVLALAGPAWERQPQPLLPDEAALVIVLDLTPAMNARDITPSRLVRTRFKLDDVLAARQAGETALVAYAGDAFVVSPLTDDVENIRTQLPSLETGIMPLAGDRPDLALDKAMELFRGAERTSGHVLLVTPGGSDRLGTLAAARDLRRRGFFLSVLGVGTLSGAPLPSASGSGFAKDDAGGIIISTLRRVDLLELAATGGGRYADISHDSADVRYLTEWFDRLRVAGAPDLCAGNQVNCEERNIELWHDSGPWLLLPLLPLAALAFRRGGPLEAYD